MQIKLMPTKFFGSKLNSALLLILIVLMVFALRIMLKDKETYLPSLDKNTLVEEKSQVLETKEYKSDKLGFSFSYPASWTSVEENINGEYKGSFGYNLNLSEYGIGVWGLSYPYKDEGRDGYIGDLTEKYLSYEGCAPHTNEVVKSKDGTEGVYTLAHLTTGLGDCEEYKTLHYAVFDVNKKVTGIIFTGDPNKISKSEFLKVVGSVDIK